MRSMFRTGLVVLVVVALVGGGLVAMAADKGAKPVSGEITVVSADGKKITVADKEYNIADAKITVDGKDGAAADLKVGMKAKLTIEGEKVTVVEVKAAGGGGKKKKQ
jgi:hypothetical protein